MGKLYCLLVCVMIIQFSSNLFAQNSESTFNPTIRMKGLVQSRFESSLTDSVDVQNKFNADPVNNNFRLRRLELRADIKLNDKWSGVIRMQLPQLKSTSTSNYGNVIELAYGEYRANDALQIRFGQFKTPYELDELTSHEDLRMIDRGTTSVLIVSNNQASYQPGLMVFGNFLKDKTPLNYYLALVNGSSRALPYDDNSQKNLVGRIEFSPVKGIRIGISGQEIFLNDSTNTTSYGADLQLIKNISEKTKLIVEGEYIVGSNITAFVADTTAPAIDENNLSGYFAQALFKIDINKSWCKTFEVGAKYENTDPLIDVDDNAFSTITGNIGFTFLPDNTARLQLNFIHTDWEKPISGSEAIVAANMFVAQLQIKI
ncbi:MAG: hypothetical protein H7Y00_02980 [Fimbriimonadaceae bacterium]|nr:hypothetical protein [Chitinophagales bacterium]